MKIIIFFAVLFLSALAQQNICYSDCKAGFCDPRNASKCTECDPGYILINNQCVGGNTQSKPIVFLKPTSRNTFNQPNRDTLACNITNNANRINTSMIFSPTVGRTFTQAFQITEPHNYLQVKFNAILGGRTTPQKPSIIFTIFDSNGNSIPGLLYSFDTVKNPVRCTPAFQAQDVFMVFQKLSSTLNYLVLEVRSVGNLESTIAVSNFILNYGNCSTQCKQCTGPTNGECSSCNGFLTSLVKNKCQGCPQHFYQNLICIQCPVECQQCRLINNQVRCTACNTKIAKLDPNSLYGCSTNFTQISHFKELNQNETDWQSNQLSGNIITKCQSYSLIAGLSIGKAGSSIFKTYNNLPVHTVINLYFSLVLVDQVGDTTAYQIQIDGQTIMVNVEMVPDAQQVFTNQCGGPAFEFITRQSFSFNHTRESANIRITFLKDYAGIRAITLVLNNQTNVQNCHTQRAGACISCRSGLRLFNNTCNSCPEGYYISNRSCLVCPINCKTCTFQSTKVVCLSCNVPLTLQDKLCVDSSGSLFSAQIFDSINTNKNNRWNFYPNLQNRGEDICGDHRILGSSSNKFNFLNASRRITGIPPHSGVIAVFKFFQIDDYPRDNSVFFTIGSNRTIYTPSNIKMNLCGNESSDAIVPIYLQDTTHTSDTLDLQIQFKKMIKFGISDFVIYLIGNQNSLQTYQLQIIPTYSISTPPVKGLTTQLVFPHRFQNPQNVNRAIEFFVQGQTASSIPLIPNPDTTLTVNNSLVSKIRSLQSLPGVMSQNSSVVSNRQLQYLLNVNRDYADQKIEARIANLSNLYYIDGNNNRRLFSQAKVATEIPRYIDIDQNDSQNRAHLRNLYNLFRGLAILALFIGLASFLFGLSTAFDDFFFLCQYIFVHVFIQLAYNPPSVRIPFEGLSIVQFLSWFPWQGRQAIQQAIIPRSLYQYTPLVYQQYYKDIVFARTIYQTVLFLIAMAVFWLIVKLILTVWNPKDQKAKFNNYLLYYYDNYNSRKLAFVDKVVRFIYFTVVWACILQFIKFSNEPRSFNIWNSVLTILFFILALAYPAVVFVLLRRYANSMQYDTFNKVFQDLRVTPDTLYYFLFRYYKKVVIAVIIGVLYDSNPIIPLIVLIVINLVDAIIQIMKKPLWLKQQEIINATIFYPRYPQVYFYTSIIEQFLFIIMEILFLVLYGQRNYDSRSSYMGIGYAICAFVILLLLNGLVRLFVGLVRNCQQIYLQREAIMLSVDKIVQENKDPAEQKPIMEQMLKTEAAASRFDFNPRKSTKKASYVSKLR